MNPIKVLGGLAVLVALGAGAYALSPQAQPSPQAVSSAQPQVSPLPPASAQPKPTAPAAGKLRPSLYVDKGATMGECAQYGKWWTEGPIKVYARERDVSEVAFTLQAHEGFTAVTGNVITLAYGSAIAPKGATAYDAVGKQVPLRVGETLQLLHHQGEGAWAVQRNGRVEQVDLSMVMQGDKGFKVPEVTWWAQVKNKQGHVGYIPVERAKKLYGVDGCGGPLPSWAR